MPRPREPALRALRALHLLGPAYRLYQRLLARRAARRSEPVESADGLPVPPQGLIVLVAGPTTRANFLDKGRIGADLVRATVAADGIEFDALDDVLDWGVGCGRVIRHLGGAARPALHGCDLNPVLVRWIDENLPFVAAKVNRLEPPLPYPDASFDLVYAFSVLTHLPAQMQRPWMDEVRRVLRPGGHFLFSTHGDHHSAMLPRLERARFERGELVVRFDDLPGTNLCGAFHPEAYVRGTLARGWELRLFRPQGATANGRQDLWLLRR
jgi:SAM-dependent methyltransferase